MDVNSFCCNKCGEVAAATDVVFDGWCTVNFLLQFNETYVWTNILFLHREAFYILSSSKIATSSLFPKGNLKLASCITDSQVITAKQQLNIQNKLYIVVSEKITFKRLAVVFRKSKAPVTGMNFAHLKGKFFLLQLEQRVKVIRVHYGQPVRQTACCSCLLCVRLLLLI